jgi:murein DD-endopeptidase MepM/ murein hydrolase activator NlpD
VSLRRLTVAVLIGAMAAVALPSAAPAAYRYGARVLKVGSKGKDVRRLQRNLTALGYRTLADGVYGATTKRTVKRFERKRGWRVDGRVSRKDAARIAKLVAKRARKPTTLYYVYGLTSPSVTMTAQKAGEATVGVVDLNSGVQVATLPVSFDSAGAGSVAWTGNLTGGGAAPDSIYKIVLADPGSAGAAISGGQTKRFLLRTHAFPVLGAHKFGGSGARFGAPRSGHTHQGQDVPASCGTPLVAAASGSVLANAYQAGGAGNYLVIQGSVTGSSYVYMHLKKPSWAPKGTTVHAGQTIGKVGATGDARGCHLHFERWTTPGWYLGGHPYDPLPELRYWDAYS